MVVSIEKKLDLVMSAIYEMKNDFDTRLDKIETRIEEKYQELAKTTNAKLAMLSRRIEKLEKIRRLIGKSYFNAR